MRNIAFMKARARKCGWSAAADHLKIGGARVAGAVVDPPGDLVDYGMEFCHGSGCPDDGETTAETFDGAANRIKHFIAFQGLFEGGSLILPEH